MTLELVQTQIPVLLTGQTRGNTGFGFLKISFGLVILFIVCYLLKTLVHSRFSSSTESRS